MCYYASFLLVSMYIWQTHLILKKLGQIWSIRSQKTTHHGKGWSSTPFYWIVTNRSWYFVCRLIFNNNNNNSCKFYIEHDQCAIIFSNKTNRIIYLNSRVHMLLLLLERQLCMEISWSRRGLFRRKLNSILTLYKLHHQLHS